MLISTGSTLDRAAGRPRDFSGRTAETGPAALTKDDYLPACLARFAPITLAEISRVSLQDRVEVKYLFPYATLAPVLAELTDAYAVLVVAGQRLSRYRTLYFDTAGFAMYSRHHAGVHNRYKVRSRQYVESNASFLEVKHKINKRRTVKHRIVTPELVTSLANDPDGFLHDESPYPPDELFPCLWNSYTRITLVNRYAPERVTLDMNLAFDWQGRQAQLPAIVIAEVKQPVHAPPSAFQAQMRAHQVRRTGFSKYCVGVSLLYPELKHNRFKPTQRLVAKLSQGAGHEYH